MLARALHRELLLEAVTYLVIAAALVLAAGWLWYEALLAVLDLALALRAMLIGLTFGAAWRGRSRVPPALRLGGLAAIRLVLSEYLAFIILYSVIQPFVQRFMGEDDLRRVAPGEQPLLLVHGYCCNRGAWWRLRRRLEDLGYTIATVNLEPVGAGIDDYVETLRRRIEEVCTATGVPQLILVAHSMGGLAARAYLRKHGADRVARLITLGTPHQGTLVAHFGMGRNARQMELGSDWLQRLAADTALLALPVTSIYSVHDNFVMPQLSQELHGADNRRLAGVGHLSLLLYEDAGRQLLAALARPSAQKAA